MCPTGRILPALFRVKDQLVYFGNSCGKAVPVQMGGMLRGGTVRLQPDCGALRKTKKLWLVETNRKTDTTVVTVQS